VLVESRDEDIKVPIKGYFTGSQKWNPEIGLQRLISEMTAGTWDFPYQGDHDDPLHVCRMCDLKKEMLDFPYESETTDMIMSLWLADVATRGGAFDENVPSGAVGSKTRSQGW